MELNNPQNEEQKEFQSLNKELPQNETNNNRMRKQNET